MDIGAAIARAATPDTHFVCGVRLRPYCVGHWRLLTRCGISFVSPSSRSHSLGDLLVATLICSDYYEAFEASLHAGGLRKAMARWQRRLSGGWRGSLRRTWKRFRRLPVYPDEVVGFNFVVECRKFQAYLTEHTGESVTSKVSEWNRPRTMVKTEGTIIPSAPEMELVFDCLTAQLGLNDSAALNMPLPLARWRIAVHSERNGWAKIINDDTQSDQEAANAFLRSLMEKEAHGKRS